MSKTARMLTKGSSLRSLYYLSHVVVSFFMTPFVVYSLGDRLYGFWAFVGVLVGYYGLLDLGLAEAVQRYIPGAVATEDYKGCNRIFNTALPLFLALGFAVFLVTLLAYLLSPFLAGMTGNQEDAALFGKIILILGINMAIEFPLRLFLGVLASQLRYDIMSALQLLTLFLRTALVVIVLLSGYQLIALALVTVLASIPQKILTVYFAKKNLPQVQYDRKEWDFATARTLFGYSLYILVAKLADILRFNIDFVVVSTFIGLSAVTHYSIGSILAGHFMFFISSTIVVLLPVFSRLHGREDHENIKRVFFFANKISVYLSSFIGFGLIFWGRPFIERWMGPSYLDAYPVLFLLVLGFIFAFWQNPSFDLLLGTTGYRFVAAINIIEGVSNLVLSLILVRRFGLIGVALGTLIPMAIIKLIVQPIYVSRFLTVRYFEFVGRISRAISVVALALLCPALISIIFAAPDYRALIALSLISFTLYLPVLWFYGFDHSEAEIIRGVIFPKRIKSQVADSRGID